MLGISSNGLLMKRQREFGVKSIDYVDYRAKYDIHVFDIIDTEDKAYWLGFLYADGNVRSDNKNYNNNTISLKLSYVDYNHILKYKTFMKDQRPDSIIRIKEKLSAAGNPQKEATYDVCNGHLRNSLINLGCVPAKSNILTFPSKDIFIGNELVYDFIRGYIDGDGCLSEFRKRLCISIRGTFEFLNGLREYFPDQFTKVYSEHDKNTGNTLYKLCCYSNKADNVAYRLYENANIYLDRKYNKYATLCKLHGETLDKNGETN